MIAEAGSFCRIERHIRQTTATIKPLSGLNPARYPKTSEGQDISQCLAFGETQVPGPGNDLSILYKLDTHMRPQHSWIGFSINKNTEFCFQQWLTRLRWTISLRTIRRPRQNIKNDYLKASGSCQSKENFLGRGLAKPEQVRSEWNIFISQTIDSKNKRA